ncbi:MAG: aminoacyl-tRNA hydrolase [Planctomycetes bacterium]|nr:aminoacyl-tRNA hydrolase [Planctomycetota bacterium]
MPTRTELRERAGAKPFTFVFSRSGGPGGQNVNKVSTRVTLLFDLLRCRWLTPAEKDRVAARLRTRLTAEGCVQIVSSRHRTQAANRAAAVERFFELLEAALEQPRTRRPTRPTKSSVRRRLAEKRTVSERKRLRSGAGRED